MTTDLVPQEERAVALFEGSPEQVVARATQMANVLKKVIDSRKLYTDIQGKKHVKVEGWTTLGAMLGVFPVIEWTRPLVDDNTALPHLGWEARCVVKRPDGAIIGAAEAQCTRGERMWATRDDYALRSMAQTRATSKAMRLPLAWVMTLAGYEATPAEEMPATQPARRPAATRTKPPDGGVAAEPLRQDAEPSDGTPAGGEPSEPVNVMMMSKPQRNAIRGSLEDVLGKDEQKQVEWLQHVAPEAVQNLEVHLGTLTMDQASHLIDVINAKRDGEPPAAAAAVRKTRPLPRD